MFCSWSTILNLLTQLSLLNFIYFIFLLSLSIWIRTLRSNRAMNRMPCYLEISATNETSLLLFNWASHKFALHRQKTAKFLHSDLFTASPILALTSPGLHCLHITHHSGLVNSHRKGPLSSSHSILRIFYPNVHFLPHINQFYKTTWLGL